MTRKLLPAREAQRLEIVYVAIATLKPAPYNPRVIDEAAYQRLKRGIEAFGLVEPFVARGEDRLVIGGHQRLRAATELGHAEVPVLFRYGMSDAQAAALNVLLNNPNAQGSWDPPSLAQVLALIDRSDVDLSLTGFDLDAAKALLSWGDGAAIENYRSEWAGMPEFATNDQRAYHHLTVHFEDEAAIVAFAALVQRDVTKATHYLWFPPQKPVTAADKAYVAAVAAAVEASETRSEQRDADDESEDDDTEEGNRTKRRARRRNNA